MSITNKAFGIFVIAHDAARRLGHCGAALISATRRSEKIKKVIWVFSLHVVLRLATVEGKCGDSFSALLQCVFYRPDRFAFSYI